MAEAQNKQKSGSTLFWILVCYSRGALFRKSAIAFNPNYNPVNPDPITYDCSKNKTFGIVAVWNSTPVQFNFFC